MYLDEIAVVIRSHVPTEALPESDLAELFRLYAVLLRAKGSYVCQSDVHDAWCAWKAEHQPRHDALVPYNDLPESTQDQDRVFATAIKRAADQLGYPCPTKPSFAETLFPLGPPTAHHVSDQTVDLYKMMVDSSEKLVSRRQAVNTFFLTINGALLTAYGLIAKSSDVDQFGEIGALIIAAVGIVLCHAWRSLINSFGQLNTGKFKVINTIERYLDVSIYLAEWEALGRGKDPKIYKSFTSREIWVPSLLTFIHGTILIVCILVALGYITFKSTGAA